MFYSQFILAKKGPLGTIWIAAHLERKLRKNQVADTDIGVSVDSILSPDVPIALRLSSHLLLGVVRIYSRKVNYLFHDCSEALLKVKQAFRSTAVDLPPEESTAPYHSITLPETFDLDDFELPDSDNFQGNFVDHHVSTREQITLQDSMDGVVYSTSQFGLDERFGDGDTSQIGLDLDEELMLDKVAASGHTAALLDSDNFNPEASGQPMTPYMEMDIDDDDDITGEESTVVMLGPKDANTDHETVVNNPALCGNQIQSLNFDGHGLPIELFPSTDPSPQSTQQAPYTPGLVDEAYPTNIHFSDDPAHGPVNKTSLFNSEEVISNPQCETESHTPRFVAEETIKNTTSEEILHSRGTNEAGDSILVNNKSSETDVSHLPQDTEKINIEDMNSIPSDVGHKVSSPTSVLAEQLKPASPSSSILDRAPALPDITDRTQSIQNEHVVSENPSSSDFGPIHTELFSAADITENAATTSVLMEISSEPLQSNEGVSVNPVLADAPQTGEKNMLEHVCVSHVEFPGSHNSGDLTECTSHDVNPPLVSEATHHFDKEESRGCLGPEVRGMQPSVGPDDVFSEPHLGLRPCSTILKQPDTVVLKDRNLALNATDLSLTEADLRSSILGNQDPDNASGISGPVQGVDFRPTSTGYTYLESNIPSESVRSSGQEAGFSTVEGALHTVNSRDQLGNLNFTAGFDLAVSQTERLFSATEAVPFGVSTVDGASHTVSSKDQLGNLNFTAGFDLGVSQTEKLFSSPEVVPFGVGSVDEALHTVSSKNQLGNVNFTAGFDLAVPQSERLFSAPEAVPFGVSTVDRALYTVNSKDQLGNVNFGAGFNWQVPQTERFVSAPEAVPFGGGYYPVQSTLEKVSTEREVSETQYNTLSGKKRQMMETTPVEQYSSLELPWMLSKKAFGSIPDDYDVLSSILVGRKSSALKLKPTPQQPDTSKKRQRVTPRTSLSKRKVLMDDTMVLHGDTIRLQLTSTEDIRRVRKKAPCTRPEIWRIQKHQLEDDIFIEPLITGMSSDLIGVHNRTYNAAIDVRVSGMGVENRLPEVPEDVLIQKNTDVSGKASKEDTVEPVPVEDRTAVNGPMQTPIQIDNGVSEMGVSNMLPEGPEEVLSQKNTDSSGKADREETVEPVPVEDGGAIHEPMQAHIQIANLFSDEHLHPVELDTQEAEIVEPVPVGDGGAVHEPMKTHIQIADRFSDEHLHPAELGTHDQTRPLSESVPTDLQNGQLDINVSMDINVGSGDVGEYSLLAGAMSENRCGETAGFEIESFPVDGGKGVDTGRQNGGHLDIQSMENDVAFMERKNCRADDAVHTANANEGCTPSAHDVLMENGRPAQEIYESDTVEVPEQNIVADHQLDVCNGCSPHIDIMQGNCPRDDKADVPSDAFAPLTNDKPPCSNIPVGSEGSTDPTVVINEAKEVIRSDSERIVGGTVTESNRDDTHNFPSGIVPLEDLSCPPSEFNLDRETDTSVEGENVGMQEAALEGSVDANNMSSQVASLVGSIGDETNLVDNASNSNDLEDELYENDTEFLNFDDDDDDDGAAIEEDDNNVPEDEEAEEAGTLDNSGWSSRTRGVAKYLQTLFDAERGRGRKNLSMDNLLSGKTRKEASRMFFETLVLTTRDYVQVEQQKAFDNINIKPRGKLMKSEF